MGIVLMCFFTALMISSCDRKSAAVFLVALEIKTKQAVKTQISTMDRTDLITVHE